MTIRKLIKCFVPYGFFVLRRRIEEGVLFINSHRIEREIPIDYSCNLTIKETQDRNILQICREDYEHPIYVRNHTSDVGMYREIIENQEYNFIVKKEPKYIIDAGANIGMASIYFTKKYKDAKIIAIEPEEENYALLKRNTEKYANITPINAALWNKAGEISLFDTDLGNGGFMVETNVSDLKPSTKNMKHLTKAITIDGIMHDFNIDFIDIVKMDIEGSEREVFESCKSWIHKTNCIIVELHERMKKGCNKAFHKNMRSFDQIGKYGEDIYVSRDNYIKMAV